MLHLACHRPDRRRETLYSCYSGSYTLPETIQSLGHLEVLYSFDSCLHTLPETPPESPLDTCICLDFILQGTTTTLGYGHTLRTWHTSCPFHPGLSTTVLAGLPMHSPTHTHSDPATTCFPQHGRILCTHTPLHRADRLYSTTGPASTAPHTSRWISGGQHILPPFTKGHRSLSQRQHLTQRSPCLQVHTLPAHAASTAHPCCTHGFLYRIVFDH